MVLASADNFAVNFLPEIVYLVVQCVAMSSGRYPVCFYYSWFFSVVARGSLGVVVEVFFQVKCAEIF